MNGATGAGGARQGILSLAIKDKAHLYSAYMPYLNLLDEKDRLPVAGKVVWVTPTGAQGARAAGIGVQFADSAEGEAVKGKIEALLAGTLSADKPTQTM